MTLAWPLVALVAVLLAWHRVGQWLAQRKAQQAQSEEVEALRRSLASVLSSIDKGHGEHSQRLSSLEEWHQRTLNRNGGRE